MAALLIRARALGPAALLYLTAITLVGFAVDGGVFSVLFNLYLIRLGYGPEQIGIINGVAQLTFTISALPAGALGERYGSRRMLVAGMGLMLIGCVLLSLADLVPADLRLIELFAGEAILYFGLALYFVNSAPFLMSVIARKQRTTIFGVQSALLAVAAFLGGLVGGFLPQFVAGVIGQTLDTPAPYRYPLLLASLGLIPALVAIRAARNHRTELDDEPETAANNTSGVPMIVVPSVIMAAIVMMGMVRLFQVAGLAATQSFFNVYLDQGLAIPTSQIGTITAFARLLAAPAALATPLVTRRIGNYWTVVFSTLLTALLILPIALIPHWAAAGVSLIGIIGLSSIRYASSMVYFLELVPPERRATVSGVTEMSAGLSFTLITFAGGYIITLSGYSSLFLLGAGLSAIGALIFWRYFRRFNHRETQPA